MIGGKPVLTFDTSVHNRLVHDGEKSDSIFAALKEGYFVRLAGLAIEEMIATPAQTERAALLRGFGRLRYGAHDCLLPNNELLKRLIRAYESDAARFDWRSVNATSPEYASGASDHDLIADDQLSEEQRRHLMDQKKALRSPFLISDQSSTKYLKDIKRPILLAFGKYFRRSGPKVGWCGASPKDYMNVEAEAAYLKWRSAISWIAVHHSAPQYMACFCRGMTVPLVTGIIGRSFRRAESTSLWLSICRTATSSSRQSREGSRRDACEKLPLQRISIHRFVHTTISAAGCC